MSTLLFGFPALPGAWAAPTVVITDPPAGATISELYLPTILLQATATDPDASISYVTFYVCKSVNATCDVTTTVVTVTTPPYQVAWTPTQVAQGSVTQTYRVFAQAGNTLSQLGASAGVDFTVVQLSPAPRITLVAPDAPDRDRRYIAPASPVLYATASPGDTSPPSAVARVDFLEGETVIGTLTAPNSVPSGYAFVWQNPAPGMHSIAARVTDTLGYTTSTNPIAVAIISPGQPPQVTLAAPTTGQIFTTASVVPLSATSTSPPADIQRVEFIAGNNIVATALAPPYTGSWTQPPAGNFTIVARAVDAGSGEATSAAAYVQVVAARAPAAVLTAPAPGTTVSSLAPLTLSADALAPDGAIGHVDFYAGTTVVGSAATSPYTFTWPSPTTGPQSLTARAYDLPGNVGISAPVAVTVSQAVQTQTISFGSLATKTLGTAPFAVSASASSNLSVAFSSRTVPICTVSGNTVTLLAVGTCTIRASQAGNASFAPAPNVDQSFTVTAGQTSQTITFGTLADQTFGTAPLILSATATSGLPVTFSALTAAICTVNGNMVTLVAAGTCTIRAAQAGNATFAPAPNVDQSFQVIPSANLTISTPTANASIAADFVLVSGTYQAPPNSGVTINGVVARNDGQGHYFVNNLPLTNGANTLTVTLTTSAGQTTTLTQTITSMGTAPMQVYAEPDADLAPATYTIRVTNRTANTITGISYLNLGGGQLDTSTQDQTTLGKITYATPAVYMPSFAITDSAGNTYTQTLAILAQDKAALDQMLKAVWGNLAVALANGNKDLAMQMLSGSSQTKYGVVFDSLAPDLANIISTWSVPASGMLSDGIGEYAIRRNVDGVNRLFLIYLLRGIDGVWRVDSM